MPRHQNRTQRGADVSAHIEWLNASETNVEVLAPGDEWVGEGLHHQHVLTLAQDEIVAIEGTPAEIRAFAARINAVAQQADELIPIDGAPKR